MINSCLEFSMCSPMKMWIYVLNPGLDSRSYPQTLPWVSAQDLVTEILCAHPWVSSFEYYSLWLLYCSWSGECSASESCLSAWLAVVTKQYQLPSDLHPSALTVPTPVWEFNRHAWATSVLTFWVWFFLYSELLNECWMQWSWNQWTYEIIFT